MSCIVAGQRGDGAGMVVQGLEQIDALFLTEAERINAWKLAIRLENERDFNRCSRVWEKIVQYCTVKLGKSHQITLQARGNRAAAYSNNQQHAKAMEDLHELLALREAALGPEHEDTMLTMQNLGREMYHCSRHTESTYMFEQCLERKYKVYGRGSCDVLYTEFWLAKSLVELGKLHESERILEQCYPAMLRQLQEHEITHVEALRDMVKKSLQQQGTIESATTVSPDLVDFEVTADLLLSSGRNAENEDGKPVCRARVLPGRSKSKCPD